MPVKKYGLGLQDPVTSVNNKYISSLHASSKIIGAITGASAYSTANDLLTLREESRDGKKYVITPMAPNSRD